MWTIMSESDFAEDDVVVIRQKKKNFQNTFMCVGGTLIILAVASIAVSIAAVSVGKSIGWYCSACHLTVVGAGIWGSIFIITTGVLAMICGKTITPCLLTWTFMSSVISCVFNLVSGCLAFAAAISSVVSGQTLTLVPLNIVVFSLSLAEMVLTTYICLVFGKIILSNLDCITVGDVCGTCCDFKLTKLQTALQSSAEQTAISTK